MNFNLEQVPFSRYGSYFAFSKITEHFRLTSVPPGLYLRTVHGDAMSKEMMTIDLIKGDSSVPFEIKASPEKLRLEAKEGYVEICIPEPKIIRFKGEGVGLRLSSNRASAFDNAIPYEGDLWIINTFGSRVQLILTSLKGKLNIDAPWDGLRCKSLQIDILPDNTGFECAIEEFYSSWIPHSYEDFEKGMNRVKEEYKSFLNKMPEVPEEFSQARELAGYIDWSCVVEPNGLIKRPGMLMSKNWMTNIWSWDHCFNAIALSYKNPELAWDQLMVMFDHQDKNGAIPDSINDYLLVWNFSKPPIHGWALKKMMENTDYIDNEKLLEIYEPLCRWTNWWLNYRDYDNDGIPQYNHGNDSGWDNSTVFIERPPIESPDLSTFLVIQMEVLSDIANRLRRKSEAKMWKEKSYNLLDKLLKHSLRDDRLVALQSGTHKQIESQSLLLFIPILLAKRLPQKVLENLISRLKEGDMITKYGLATEGIKSPYYESDGYWRGPIWAPSTMLIIDGLKESGEEALAKDIALKFANLCSKSGFAENYDALTGEGLRDKAYTWTSSVFLALTYEYSY
ncbi:MAG: amylo-alpha-1,6-glucosidase [bacterium]